MKIPTEPGARIAFFREILGNCINSRDDRRGFYDKMKLYYMQGTDGTYDVKKVFNKTYGHIDQVSSFMYSQETTQFSIEIGPSISDIEYFRTGSLTDAVHKEWNSSNTDVLYGLGLRWAMVYGSMFIKYRWKGNGLQSFLVEPHNFGVLREDICSLSEQEAFSHSYSITQTQLRNELISSGNPNAEAIVQATTASTTSQASPQGTSGVDRIITSASTPTMVGNVGLISPSMNLYSPKVAEPLVEMHELYIYDDEIADYRVLTMADPGEVIYDRALSSMSIGNQAPFVQICPSPLSGYFWGESEVNKLFNLQDMLNHRMAQIQHMMEMQANPAKFATGFAGVPDEIKLAMDMPGGMAVSDMPGAKMDTLQVQIPEDLFMELGRIETMFDEVSGIQNVTSGRGEVGVRSTGHASLLARLGSSRIKTRALIVEDSLEKLATCFLMMIKKYDPRHYQERDSNDSWLTKMFGKGSKQFLASQFTNDFVVKVDAHSNSPIFMEDQKDLAFALLDRKVITRERVLQMIQAPMRRLLEKDLENDIIPGEQASAAAQMQLEQEKIKAKGGP